MNSMNVNQDHEVESLALTKASFAEKIARLTFEKDDPETAIPTLSLRRLHESTELTSYIHDPSICLIAQGSKRVLLGEDVYAYDAHHYLITSVNLPLVAQVLEASGEKPYLSLKLDLDQREIARMMVDSELAAHVRMSTSTFHHHFRSLTAMSPLQFQKSLRLHEARQLMFMEHLDAATAAFQVGYESPSQFSREYSRQFGAPPLKDITSLHRMTGGERRMA